MTDRKFSCTCRKRSKNNFLGVKTNCILYCAFVGNSVGFGVGLSISHHRTNLHNLFKYLGILNCGVGCYYFVKKYLIKDFGDSFLSSLYLHGGLYFCSVAIGIQIGSNIINFVE